MEDKDNSIESQINQILGNRDVVQEPVPPKPPKASPVKGFATCPNCGKIGTVKDVGSDYVHCPDCGCKWRWRDRIYRRTVEFQVRGAKTLTEELNWGIRVFHAYAPGMMIRRILVRPEMYNAMLREANAKVSWLPWSKHRFVNLTSFADIPLETRKELTPGRFAIVGEKPVLP